MGKTKDLPADMFMQFKDITVLLNGANTSTLEEQEIDTGLSIRGRLVWLIHLIEVSIPLWSFTAPLVLDVGASTRVGLAAMPPLGDPGVLFRASLSAHVATEGGMVHTSPMQLRYLPPFPLAAPKLSVYAQSDADEAAFQGKPVSVRLGFTTAPLDAAMYTEIAETWGW